MKFLDCRQNAQCDCQEDVDFLYSRLTKLAYLNVEHTEFNWALFEELFTKVSLLAEKIGVQFVEVPEVPAIPEHLILEPIKKVKKVAKKIIKKAKKK